MRNHVVAIDLAGNSLSGSFPAEIVQLRFLTTLKLRDNPNLRGTLPREIYAVPHLKFCYVGVTKIQHAVPYNIAHSFQITQLKPEKLHESADPQSRRQIKCTASNAAGPERATAVTKLQRIYRARIERTKFCNFMPSPVEMKVDPATGCTYYVNVRTGEVTWEKPSSSEQTLELAPLQSMAKTLAVSHKTQQRRGNLTTTGTLKGESSWETPSFLSRVNQELCERYGTDKTDDERFELFFQDIDRDGTGEIDQDECAHLCGDLGMALSAKQITEVCRELDSSGDGQLDRKEIIAGLTRIYK